jgi:hypothetical protein
MKRKHWLTFFILITVLQLSAQQFGGFPPSTKWKQINSDTARIIFTGGAEWQANRIATLIHKAAVDTPTALGNKLRKISVVLQSRTTLANGYVALGPFRSEYYLVPGSNIFDFGNLPWHENLAIHEYRHVQQYNNFNNGITKGFYFLFGEQGQAFANAITIPDWFFEGDAVHAETALTTSGRGRQAFFLSGYNSLWLENKNYSWQKLRNGSLKDFVPNHYQLGYLLVNYGYLKYGKEFWKNVTQDASRFKGLFYPFQKAVEKYSGVDYKTFRKEGLNFYKQKLGASTDSSTLNNKTVTNYFYPQFISNDSLLYLKRAYDKTPSFYIQDKKGEHRVSRQNISSEEWFSYSNGKIAYTAYSTNARWSLIDYSDIVVLDINTKKERTLTSKGRYYTPDFSPSGNKIVAVKITDSLQTELHIINSNNGELVKKFNEENDYYVNPRFVDEGRVVVGLRTTDAKMSLQLLDIGTGKLEQLIPSSYNTIGMPYVNGNTVFFTANFNGNDDVYAIRLKDKKITQLSSGFTGNYFPSVLKDTLVWSHFTTKGMEIRKQAMSSLAWGEINALSIQEQPHLYPVALEKNILSTRTERFSAKRYSKSTNLINFHSWAPNYSDPEFTFSLYSDNILNTFSNELFYRYNQNENSHGVGWNTSYGGFFPKLNVGVEYTYNREIKTSSSTITLDQLEARVGYNIPLNFTKGKTYKLLNFGSNYVFNRLMSSGFQKDSFNAINRTYLHHFINWVHYLPTAVQHIYPKFGYTASVAHRQRIDDKGYQFVSNGQLFLPSFANHSIVLQASFQQTDTSNILFSNRFANSRGYEDYYFSRMWKLGANYHFPILYPDFGIASIVYFQRLRGNAFYDLTRVYSRNKKNTADMRSVGGELFFDTKWWNQLPVSFGVRVSYLMDNGFSSLDRKGNTFFEFIVPVGLIQN